MDAVNRIVRIKYGQRGRAVMPHSEVCMHMKVAGKVMDFVLLYPDVENGRILAPAVQLLKDGHPFSGPITHGEAGIYEDASGFYYYPGHDEPINTDPAPFVVPEQRVRGRWDEYFVSDDEVDRIPEDE